MKNKPFNFIDGPYYYIRDKDGCDNAYILASDAKTAFASLPFWDDEDGSIEATAQLFAASTRVLDILESLIDQIGDLKGESSVIDEDLMQGEAFKEGVRLIASLKS